MVFGTVYGSGNDIYASPDTFWFVYQPISGDCDIRAKVTGMRSADTNISLNTMSGVGAGAKAGVMIRETLDGASTFAMMDMTPNNLEFIYRITNGSPSATSFSGSAPYWVRLTRTNNTFTGYYSANGTTWTQAKTVTLPMANTVYVGLPVCAWDGGRLVSATFTNVSVSGSLGVPTTPTGLNETTVSGQVNLSWNASAGSYKLQCKAFNDQRRSIFDHCQCSHDEFYGEYWKRLLLLRGFGSQRIG